MFSVGAQYNKKLVNYSAIIVYSGILLFFFAVLLSDVKITVKAFISVLEFNNFLNSSNIAPILTVAGTIFTYFSIIIISFGDFSRHVKSEDDLKKVI